MASGVDSYRNVKAYGNLADASSSSGAAHARRAVLARRGSGRPSRSGGEGRRRIGKALGIIEALLLGLRSAAATSRSISSCTTTRRARCSKPIWKVLKEVSSLLREMRLGWDGIAAEARGWTVQLCSISPSRSRPSTAARQRARELEGARLDAMSSSRNARATAGLPNALADLYARNQRMLGDVDRERRRLLRESALVRARRRRRRTPDVPDALRETLVLGRQRLRIYNAFHGHGKLPSGFALFSAGHGPDSDCVCLEKPFQISMLCDHFTSFPRKDVATGRARTGQEKVAQGTVMMDSVSAATAFPGRPRPAISTLDARIKRSLATTPRARPGESGCGKELVARPAFTSSPSGAAYKSIARRFRGERIRTFRPREGLIHRRARHARTIGFDWPLVAPCSSTRSAT